MKKKVLKIIAFVIAVALIVGIAWVANGLNGNPISKMLAKKAANKYLEEHFLNTDYYIEELGFSFKFTGYYAHVRSETSIDTQFTLEIDMLGNVCYDTYDDVVGGFITARRVEQEYRKLTDQIFTNPSFVYKTDIQYGTLEIYPQEAFDDPLVTDIPSYSLVQDDLVIDKVYDIRELGRLAGHLIVYVDDQELTFENAAKILLDIKSQFDEANLPFRAIDLTMRTDGERINFDNFPYEDIYEGGLAERIKAAHDALEAYYAEQDGK